MGGPLRRGNAIAAVISTLRLPSVRVEQQDQPDKRALLRRLLALNLQRGAP